MLKELAEMINKEFGLTGKDLEAAVYVVGAALADTLITERKPGFTKWYDVANHFQKKLNDIRIK